SKSLVSDVGQPVGECELEHGFLVLQAFGSPEIAGVCEEVERSSKCLVEAAERTAAIGDLLADLDLSLFQAADSVLVNRDDRKWLRLRDAVEESLDVALDFRELRFEAASIGLCRGQPVVPKVFEHGPRHREQL